MADDVQNDPYDSVLVHPGKEAFIRLCRAEYYFRVTPSYLVDQRKIDPRKTAVRLIETIHPRTTHAFDHLIPYTAITYFDRFYATHDEFPDVLQNNDATRNRELFTICCLTISWKLRDKSFFLERFLKFLERTKNIVYTFVNVREMELAICRGLEWRMRTITPILFAGFFIPFQQILSPIARSVFHDLIYISQRDIAFNAYTASVIAVSAVLAVASVMDSPENSNLLQITFINEVDQLKPVVDKILECKARLVALFNDPNQDDDFPAHLRLGPGPSFHPLANVSPGQTSSDSDDDPPPPAGPALDPGPPAGQASGPNPSSAPGQTSADSGGITPTGATERPRRRQGKEPVTNFGPLQLRGQTSTGKDRSPALVLGPSSHQSTNIAPGQTSASIDDPPAPGQTSGGSSGTPPAAATEALAQDAGDIQLAVATQDDQITGQVGDEEAEDLEERELDVAERSGRTSIAQKLQACCTIL